MSVLLLMHLVAGGAVTFFFTLFALTSVFEGKQRAAWIGFSVCLVFAAVWLALVFLFAQTLWLLLLPAVVAAFALLFFFQIKKPTPLKITEINEKVDERDVIFAREEYLPGTEKHETYYKLRPENRAVDDKLRDLPELLCPGGRYYVAEEAEYVADLFHIIEGMLDQVDGNVGEPSSTLDPATTTRHLKEMALRLGASEVGVAMLNPAFIYSNVGRGPEHWGAPIETCHKYALVFSLEMGKDQVECAPRLGITRETATQYLKGAQISIAMARYIRDRGYPARAHMAGSNYQIMLPPVAHDAGLGELGRMGYLISKEFGARIRLGAITTDLELIPDKPITFGVQDFCDKCKKCANNCPSGAIPRDGKIWVRGAEKWPLNIEKCLGYWRRIGTDCGLCMKVCPYSHPPTFVHNVVRGAIQGSPVARTLSVWGDDFFYGKRLYPPEND